MAKRVTEEEFLQRSIEKHGDKYSYHLVEYKNTMTKVKIICKKCQEDFDMAPESHMIGQGCKACGYERNGLNRRTDFDKFVEDSRTHHGDKFDYSKVEWKGSKKSIELFCPVHQSIFKTTPYIHRQGADCPACAKIAGGLKNRSTTGSFVKEAEQKFGSRYDYSETVYVKSNEKVRIRCNRHDKWLEMTPNFHLNSAGGCPDCATEATGERCRKTTEQFIADARKVHGDRYSYDRTEYKTVNDKVEIYCREHGYFWQNAGSHTQGQGCSKCGNNGYKVHKPASLYVFSDGELTKVGITNKKPEVRCNFISKDSGRNFRIIRVYQFSEGQTPLNIETKLLQELWDIYESPLEKFSGFTECFFSIDMLKLTTRIEELIKEHEDAQPQ